MICLRCQKEFDNSIPEITNPRGNTEIATDEWCASCNRLAMNLVFRGSSAYKTKVGELGYTLIAVDLFAPAYRARSPSGEERKELEKWIEKAKKSGKEKINREGTTK